MPCYVLPTYPACSTFQDVSVHSSAEAREEAKKIIADELREGRTVGLVFCDLDPEIT